MKILALESSAVAASVAICENDKIIGEFFLQTGQTHSQTLMPMVEQLLAHTNTQLSDLDGVAVAVGPGSFTGLRIAIGAVKGIAMGADIPCFGVSTLHAMAYNMQGMGNCRVCVTMDARCSQVYTALFEISGNKISRIWEDMAISVDELGNNLQKEKKNCKLPIFLVGDGAEMCYNIFTEVGMELNLAPPHLRSQRGVSVAFAAMDINEPLSHQCLQPSYLRLPQAERELLAKNK